MEELSIEKRKLKFLDKINLGALKGIQTAEEAIRELKPIFDQKLKEENEDRRNNRSK